MFCVCVFFILIDFCYFKNYRVLEDDGSRLILCINLLKNFCDSQFSIDWYCVVKDVSDILMLIKCVNMLSCGIIYFIWLNGYYLFIVIFYIEDIDLDLIFIIIIN